jgi:hypothetical protein
MICDYQWCYEWINEEYLADLAEAAEADLIID